MVTDQDIIELLANEIQDLEAILYNLWDNLHILHITTNNLVEHLKDEPLCDKNYKKLYLHGLEKIKTGISNDHSYESNCEYTLYDLLLDTYNDYLVKIEEYKKLTKFDPVKEFDLEFELPEWILPEEE
jgi:hypothetical protein